MSPYAAGTNSGATTACPRDVMLNRISFTGRYSGSLSKPQAGRGVGEAEHDGAVRRLALGGLRVEAGHQDFGAVLLEERPQTGQIFGAIAVDVTYLLHQDEIGSHAPPGVPSAQPPRR